MPALTEGEVVASQTVNLAWEAPTHNAPCAEPPVEGCGTPLTDLAGYRLYQSQISGQYGVFVQEPSIAEAMVTGLAAGQTFFWRVTAVDTSGNESLPSNEVSHTVAQLQLPGPVTNLVLNWNIVACPATTVTFDNPAPAGSSGAYLNGSFGGINWGTNQWRWETAYGANPTRHIYFDSAVGSSRTFTFAPAPRRLRSLRVFTVRPTTISLGDDRGQVFTQTIPVGSLVLLMTNWGLAATVVTVTSTDPWAPGFDDITFDCS